MTYSSIIATSQKRIEWLINRSLRSIYNQINIDKLNWKVFVVDDNEDELEFVKIKNQVQVLRQELNLKESEFQTIILKNKRTRFMSGTGAWNTGIMEAFQINPEGFIAILDDDDEYLPNHLSMCIQGINVDTVAVFQRLIWKNDDGSTMNIDLTKEKLIPENFFIGNPGIQGSNMFFKTKSLVDIGGFDENLPNTTDRDLMIRFLWKNDIDKIKTIENIGVIHYNHDKTKVNNNIPLKQKGLDVFYEKYKSYFSESAYQKSLIRAKNYFNYIPIEER
jgi:hypothetical protein